MRRKDTTPASAQNSLDFGRPLSRSLAHHLAVRRGHSGFGASLSRRPREKPDTDDDDDDGDDALTKA
ncbi:proteasome subunit beta type-5 [Anopheles sinensis]|uniref:Proteasome subunit beta type-5 n=1 Tax=Anopheles sinensis TaxID=74873 RepID=A0A084VTF0_ANOSI|nr:proteasome subunit beta type-5 [Anopheles sinensis]